MTKNKISERLKGLTVGLVCSVLLVGGIVLANTYYADTVNVYQNEESEENLGGITFEAEDFVEGFKVNSEWVRDTDNIEYYNIFVAGSFDDRVTTTDAIVDLYSTTTWAYWQNPNSDKDVVVEDLYFDNTEAFSAIASGFKCGTTTSEGTMAIYPNNDWVASSTHVSGGLSIIASTTFATTFNPLVDGFIGVDNYPGTAFNTYDRTLTKATSTKFILGEDEFIVCTWNMNAFATSSASATVHGGFTGAINLVGKAYVRGE